MCCGIAMAYACAKLQPFYWSQTALLLTKKNGKKSLKLALHFRINFTLYQIWCLESTEWFKAKHWYLYQAKQNKLVLKGPKILHSS